MGEIGEKIREKLLALGFKYKTVNISHLPEILETIHKLGCGGTIDRKVNDNYFKYVTDTSKKPADAKSIFIIAMPSPITRVTFTLPFRMLQTMIPPQYIGREDDALAQAALSSVLEPAGFKVTRARLPLKTLAVRSGLAIYRRNNLAYVPEMGSFLRLIAFYSDFPVETDDWQPLNMELTCESCFRCLENCPTHCIDTDRFIVHAERCLTFLNERKGDFPDWAPAGFHNALIGCLRCQDVCPVDKPYLKNVKNGPVFTLAENNLFLGKTPFHDLPPETQEKLKRIEYDDTWLYPLLARNLAVLINK